MLNQKNIKMKKFKVNDRIEIGCEYKKSRNGFRHIATLYTDGKVADKTSESYLNRTWESYEYQTVMQKLIKKTDALTEDERKIAMDFVENYKETDKGILGMAAMVAKMGEVFADTDEEKNTWKKRMLGTVPGIDFPEDWDTLSEEEKKRRLDGAIDFGLEK